MTARLAVALVRGRSHAVDVVSAGPLRLLTPSHDGTAAWAYVSSLGGGFVGTDALSLEVEVGAGAQLFLGSQSSTKVYRGTESTFALTARLAEGSTLISWPEPVVCFDGASLEQAQRFELAERASLISVDSFTSGRMGRGERWTFKRFVSRLQIDLQGEPWLRDAQLLSNGQGALLERMSTMDAFATVVLVGPAFGEAVKQVLEERAKAPLNEDPFVTASPRDDGAIVRIASRTVEQLHAALTTLLAPLVSKHFHDLSPLSRRGEGK